MSHPERPLGDGNSGNSGGEPFRRQRVLDNLQAAHTAVWSCWDEFAPAERDSIERAALAVRAVPLASAIAALDALTAESDRHVRAAAGTPPDTERQ